MNPLLQRVAKAYRPLQLRGLLLDGQYRLPSERPREPASTTATGRRRFSLAALTGLHHFLSLFRSKP